ncbi:hypothetical protein [Streptomyces sp. enrichment culture]|uniref:hypothetical protein n=1 Tax=Streptomyces sp. enrichment culture TaxID=1795815 RepID=UPI003F554CBD
MTQSPKPSPAGGRRGTGHSRHPADDRPHHPDDDRTLLRVILAVPVVLLTLAAAFFFWLGINTRPDGDGDQAAYGGMELAWGLTIVMAGAVGSLWLAPSVRWAMRWPWVVPAAVLGLAAAVRWVSSGG